MLRAHTCLGQCFSGVSRGAATACSHCRICRYNQLLFIFFCFGLDLLISELRRGAIFEIPAKMASKCIVWWRKTEGETMLKCSTAVVKSVETSLHFPPPMPLPSFYWLYLCMFNESCCMAATKLKTDAVSWTEEPRVWHAPGIIHVPPSPWRERPRRLGDVRMRRWAAFDASLWRHFGRAWWPRVGLRHGASSHGARSRRRGDVERRQRDERVWAGRRLGSLRVLYGPLLFHVRAGRASGRAAPLYPGPAADAAERGGQHRRLVQRRGEAG